MISAGAVKIAAAVGAVTLTHRVGVSGGGGGGGGGGCGGGAAAAFISTNAANCGAVWVGTKEWPIGPATVCNDIGT